MKIEYERKLKVEDRQEVVRIYNDDEVSYSLPDMKYAGLRFMLFTLHEAYGVYLKKCHRKRNVAEKTFKSLKRLGRLEQSMKHLYAEHGVSTVLTLAEPEKC